MKIRETFVCEPLRTPVGKFGGAYREVSAPFLGAAVVSGLLERSGLPAEAVEDVLFAQCYASMEAPALGLPCWHNTAQTRRLQPLRRAGPNALAGQTQPLHPEKGH